MIDQTILPSFKNIARGFRDFVNMTFADNDQYWCKGIDPQCQLELSREIVAGWYVVQYQITLIEGKISNPKFYLDSGNGYNESEIISLPRPDHKHKTTVESIIYFPKRVTNVRFDPTESESAIFKISEFAIIKLSRYVLFKKIKKIIPTPGIKRYFKIAFYILINDVKKIENLISNSITKNDPFNYHAWIERYDSLSTEDLSSFEKVQSSFTYRPLISILLPTYNTPLAWLKDSIDSVFNQVYENWELCIADDNSTDKKVRTVIEEYASHDKRVKYNFRDKNGHIATASNTALSLSAGEFVTMLDHDDMFAPLALFRVVEALNNDRTIDFIYSDEDKIDADGKRSLPFFKPDWSPALFYSQNYITHLACIRKSILQNVNGFTEGMEGSQDYDLFLKVLQYGVSIKHLPYILYHWRLHEASTSMASGSKPYAHTAGKRALERFLSKKYLSHFDRVDDGEHTFTYSPRFNFSKQNKISIIIPTKDKIEYLKPCLESILLKSTWANYEIIILNNNSEEKNTFSYFEKIQKECRQIKVHDALFEFNWSKLNNFGSKLATGNYLIFLNNDISVITPGWMEMLCEYASLPEVATVGASLLYEDNTLQHAGIVVGMNGWADHVFKGMHPSHFPSPYISNVISRNVLAVTGACIAIERSKFEQLGLFDESFMICGSDVELGIRAHKRKLFNIVHGTVNLYHHESKSRGDKVPENDFVQSSIKYEPYRTQETDPFFNPNLSLLHTSPTCKI